MPSCRPAISERHSARGGFLTRAADAAVSDQAAPTAGLDDPVHDLPSGPVTGASGNPGAGLATAPYQRADHRHVDGLLNAHDGAHPWLLSTEGQEFNSLFSRFFREP